MIDLYIRGFVRLASWSLHFVARSLVCRTVVALVVAFFSSVVIFYALFFGLLLWFITGRLGMARSIKNRQLVERISLVVLVVGLLIVAGLDGASITRIASIGFAAALGAILWIGRGEAYRAVVEEVRARTVTKRIEA